MPIFRYRISLYKCPCAVLEGPVGSTLFEMTVNEEAVTEQARDLMKEQQNRVEENKQRRRSTNGCRRGEIIF